MIAHDPKARLIGIGVFLLPLILVKATGLMIGQPPQGAVASGAVPAVVSGVIESFTPEWSLEQVAATQRVEDLRELAFGESPLLHARKTGDIEYVLPPENFIITPPDVAVRVILRSRHGNVALIDRKHFRTGDAIGEDGWFIDEIDAASRSVLIVHRESGMKATLVVPLPR